MNEPRHDSQASAKGEGGVDPEQPLAAGDNESYQRLFEAYSTRLVHLAAKHIHPRLLKRFDGEDVIQSVFRTFFRRHAESQISIRHSEHLWKLLVRLTILKTRSLARRHTAECRNAMASEVDLETVETLSREPVAEDALALWEEVDGALQGLPERAAEIVALRLEGLSRSEIAHKLGVSRQTVYRILELVERRLEHRLS